MVSGCGSTIGVISGAGSVTVGITSSVGGVITSGCGKTFSVEVPVIVSIMFCVVSLTISMTSEMVFEMFSIKEGVDDAVSVVVEATSSVVVGVDVDISSVEVATSRVVVAVEVATSTIGVFSGVRTPVAGSVPYE